MYKRIFLDTTNEDHRLVCLHSSTGYRIASDRLVSPVWGTLDVRLGVADWRNILLDGMPMSVEVWLSSAAPIESLHFVLCAIIIVMNPAMTGSHRW